MWQGREREYITSGGLLGPVQVDASGGRYMVVGCLLAGACQPRVADGLSPFVRLISPCSPHASVHVYLGLRGVL
jgi:hypothetical protein